MSTDLVLALSPPSSVYARQAPGPAHAIIPGYPGYKLSLPISSPAHVLLPRSPMVRARVVQRLLALNSCIWHNWRIGAA
jgi:hypothetical protein